MSGWNPWHGCLKYSEGCENCYVYRIDASFGRDASVIIKTKDIDLPRRKKRDGSFALSAGENVFTCLSSDFFLEKADEWRDEALKMIRARQDVRFHIITKRILRAEQCFPEDWGEGYPNVAIGCTVENQLRADERLPVFLDLPIASRFIVCEPLLGQVDLSGYLQTGKIEKVIAGGESGPGARMCDFSWFQALQRQCIDAGVEFHFKQTGAEFCKDGKIYHIDRSQQSRQAKRAGIDHKPEGAKYIWHPGKNEYADDGQMSIKDF